MKGGFHGGTGPSSQCNLRTVEGCSLAEGGSSFFQGKIEIVETYDRQIASAHLTMRMPAVVRLFRLVSFHHVRQMVKFSRETLFTRDSFCCQYCGKRFDKHDLTFDHVLPAARGGPKTWENIVTACRKCNHRKSGKTPEEAGMKLLKKAERPHWSPAILVMMNLNCRGPKVWENYLYDASRTVFSQTVEPHM